MRVGFRARTQLEGPFQMDVEPSTMPAARTHAGRGDRVARTREAIVSATLTLAHGRRGGADRARHRQAGRRVGAHRLPALRRYRRALCRRAWPRADSLRGEAPDVDCRARSTSASRQIDQPRAELREAAADVDLRRDAAASLLRGGRADAQIYTVNREQLAELVRAGADRLSRARARAHPERARHVADAGRLDRDARAARPHRRTGARRVELHRQGHASTASKRR